MIMSQLIDALPEAVIVIGAADRVIAVNAAARELVSGLAAERSAGAQL